MFELYPLKTIAVWRQSAISTDFTERHEKGIRLWFLLDLSALHHENDFFHHGDVAQRIAVDGYDVGDIFRAPIVPILCCGREVPRR